MTILWMIHLGSSWAMAGLILFVHLVHYPLFGLIDRERYQDYQQLHMKRTTWIVAPLMLTEMITAILLPLFISGTVLKIGLGINLFLVILVWCSTAFLQVPEHKKLLDGYREDVGQRLVKHNIYRTIIWPGHAVLASILFLNFSTATT